MKKEVTVNTHVLTQAQNYTFVQGSFIANRCEVAKYLARIFNFPGGYRAAYRAVKNGYSANGVFAGKL